MERDMITNEDDNERRRLFSAPFEFEPFRPASAVVRVELAARSDRRGVQSDQEDNYLAVRLCRAQETLFGSLGQADLPDRFEEYGYAMLVADGIGGGGSGAVASRLALSTLAHLALKYGKWNLRVGLENV